MNAADLSVAEAGAQLRAGTLTAVRLAEAHLRRIAERDEQLQAVAALDRDALLRDAEAADRRFAAGRPLGPLDGIPVAVKDLIDTAGLATRYGSRVHANHVPAEDAAVVRRLREGGALLLAKVGTYEFALVGPSFDGSAPPPRNPWNPAHITGGSSSGSAAAVAGGLARLALGTDTGGSVRSPASYCGAVGLKPTRGRVPDAGVYPLAPSLDTVGTLAATVHEAALLFDAVADPGPSAAAGIGEGVEGLMIAYARRWFAGDPDCDPAVLRLVDDAVSTLSLLGAEIREVDLPPYDLCEAAGAVILHHEALALHAAGMRDHGASYGRLAFQSLASGLLLADRDAAEARRAGAMLSAGIDAVLATCDALVTAATLTTALPFSAFGAGPVWTPMRTIPFNLGGQPALALPAGFAHGLPAGFQIAARHGAEAMLCRIGHAFERASDHAVPRPRFDERPSVAARVPA